MWSGSRRGFWCSLKKSILKLVSHIAVSPVTWSLDRSAKDLNIWCSLGNFLRISCWSLCEYYSQGDPKVKSRIGMALHRGPDRPRRTSRLPFVANFQEARATCKNSPICQACEPWKCVLAVKEQFAATVSENQRNPIQGRPVQNMIRFVR